MTLLDDVATTNLVRVDTYAREMAAIAPRLQSALDDLAAGKIVMLCDDSERPARAELVFAASASTAALVAFAVRHGSGFLQVALPSQRCDQLGLIPQCGADRMGLPQCVTVDARARVGTGISAIDRSTTIRLLASPDSGADTFSRPGHVVPVRADMNRPVSQFDWAEAAVWMTAAAGVGSAAALTTVVSIAEPTEIACESELLRFSHLHSLAMVSTADLVAFQLPSVTLDQRLEVCKEPARLLVFDEHGQNWLCLLIGDVTGYADVPLSAAAADAIFDDAQGRGSPRIRVAIGGGRPDQSDQRLRRRLVESQSAIRRVLQSVGVHSVCLEQDWTSSPIGLSLSTSQSLALSRGTFSRA